MVTNDVSEVLDRVNLFYSQSFSTLMAYTIGLLGFVGVLVPFLFSWYQNQKSKLEEQRLLKLMEAKFTAAEQKAAEVAKKAAEEGLKQLEQKMQKYVNNLEGGIFLQQERLYFAENRTAQAADECVCSAVSFLKAEHEGNLRAALYDLTTSVLPALTKLQIEEYVTANIPAQIDNLIKKLEAGNENRRFQDCIDNIKREFNEARIRV